MKNLLIITILSVMSLTAGATDVTVATAGTLASQLGQDASTVTSLSVTGFVNASDLHFVASLPALNTLDLSKARVEAENNARLATNTADYKANHLPAYILSGAHFSEIILPAGIVEIEDGALMSTAIKSISIPASVKTIGSGAFADCRSLTQLTIPATVTSLGSHLCDGDVALTKVTFNASAVPAAAFKNCTKLTTFEGTPTEIGDYAFAGCTSLASFPFPTQITGIGSGAFYGSGLAAATLGGCSRLTTIGDYAFAHCASLASASLPDGLKTLGEGAFFGDEKLADLNIPSSLTGIADFALKGTSGITASDLLLPVGIDSIGRYGMAGMTGLSTITIPSTLATIGDSGMAGMTSLKSIDARDVSNVPELGTTVWDGVNQGKVALIVDPSMENSFLATPQWNEFSITTSGISTDLVADAANAADIKLRIDGTSLIITAVTPLSSAVVYDVNGRQLIAATPASPVTELSIPLDGITPQVLIVPVTLSTSSGDAAVTFKISK